MSPGLRHVGPLKVEVTLTLEVSGAAVVHYSGKADSGFVTHAITSEGVDIIGELPTEATLILQDQVEAAAQIDGRAIDAHALLKAVATKPSPLSSRADTKAASGALARVGRAPTSEEKA